MVYRLLVILLPLACSHFALAQQTSAPDAVQAARLDKLSQQYIASMSEKSGQVSKDIDKQTDHYLDQLQRQEAKLQSKLAKVDSLAAYNVFAGSAAKYQQLKSDFKNRSGKLQRSTGLYLPWTDTASSSLKFLSSNQLTGKLPVSPLQMKEALGKVKELEAQLRSAENVKAFIRERKEYLRQQLAKYNLGSELKKYNSTAYYYGQQLSDIKSSLSDETKAERKALGYLRQYAPFQNFLKKYGALSGLFDVPADYANTGMGGLQTVSQVQSLLSQRISGMGPDARQSVAASLGAAQAELSKLRNRFPQAGDAADLPDGLKPDPVKTQRFKKRLTFSFDIQSDRGNALLPTSSTLSLSTGYKLDSRFTIGVRAAYQNGWGKDIRHIHVSGLGAGGGGFMEWRWKKSFFLTGSAEAHYNSAIKNLEALKDYNAWQPMALTGIGKTVSLKSRFFKCTRLSVMYDWLHAMKTVPSQAIIVRAGYSL